MPLDFEYFYVCFTLFGNLEKPFYGHSLQTFLVKKTLHIFELKRNDVSLQVKTEDGFTLGIQKIAFATSLYKGSFAKSNKGDVLFLPATLLSASEVWFDNENTSMALAIARQGYTVWIGNYRGSPWSPNKVTISFFEI